MSDSDVSQIKDRLTKLEVQVVEKWTAHDKRSDERYTDLMESVHELKHKETPCNKHIELLLEQNGRIRNLEAWVDRAGWAIGVIYVALVGALINFWAHK